MQKSYEYAVQNGYTGTFPEYVDWNYQCYCRAMRRSEIKPMGYCQWRDTAGKD